MGSFPGQCFSTRLKMGQAAQRKESEGATRSSTPSPSSGQNWHSATLLPRIFEQAALIMGPFHSISWCCRIGCQDHCRLEATLWESDVVLVLVILLVSRSGPPPGSPLVQATVGSKGQQIPPCPDQHLQRKQRMLIRIEMKLLNKTSLTMTML